MYLINKFQSVAIDIFSAGVRIFKKRKCKKVCVCVRQREGDGVREKERMR